MICVIGNVQVQRMIFTDCRERADWKDSLMLFFRYIVLEVSGWKFRYLTKIIRRSEEYGFACVYEDK